MHVGNRPKNLVVLRLIAGRRSDHQILMALKGQTGGVSNHEGSVRRAIPGDLDAVLELDRAAPVGRERSALLTDRMQSGDVIIFEREGRVLGYSVLRDRAFFGRDFVELLAVGVGDRRRGVGSSLLRRAVELSTTEKIFTSTNRSNSPMVHLLEKAGWQFSGQLEGIDDGDPEMIYYVESSYPSRT